MLKGGEDTPLMARVWPVEPRAVDQEAIAFESCGKRRFPRFPSPPAMFAVKRGDLRNQHAVVCLYVGPTPLCSFVDEVFDHLLMLHCVCDLPVPAIHLFRKQLSSLDIY